MPPHQATWRATCVNKRERPAHRESGRGLHRLREHLCSYGRLAPRLFGYGDGVPSLAVLLLPGGVKPPKAMNTRAEPAVAAAGGHPAETATCLVRKAYRGGRNLR